VRYGREDLIVRGCRVRGHGKVGSLSRSEAPYSGFLQGRRFDSTKLSLRAARRAPGGVGEWAIGVKPLIGMHGLLHYWIAFVVSLLAIFIGCCLYAEDLPFNVLQQRWSKAQSQLIPLLPGLSLHLLDEGPRNNGNDPILLIHGTSSSLHTWDGWAEELKKTYRVIRFDLPGFGLTGPDPSRNYTIARYTNVVKTVLEKLEVNRVVIAGNSLGGQIAWGFTLDYPTLVSSLILIDSAGFPIAATSIPLGFRLARNPIISPLVPYILPRFVVANSVRSVFGDPSKVTEQLIDRYFDLSLRQGNRQAVVDRFKIINAPSPTWRLREISCPTLILHGKLDRLIPLSQATLFHQGIPGSKIVVFSTLGHVPQEEDPEATLLPLKLFLESLTVQKKFE